MDGIRKTRWGNFAWLDLSAEDDKLLESIANFGEEYRKETGRDFTLLIMGESEVQRLRDESVVINDFYERPPSGRKKAHFFMMPSGAEVPIESDPGIPGGFVMGVDFGGGE